MSAEGRQPPYTALVWLPTYLFAPTERALGEGSLKGGVNLECYSIEKTIILTFYVILTSSCYFVDQLFRAISVSSGSSDFLPPSPLMLSYSTGRRVVPTTTLLVPVCCYCRHKETRYGSSKKIVMISFFFRIHSLKLTNC